MLRQNDWANRTVNMLLDSLRNIEKLHKLFASSAVELHFYCFFLCSHVVIVVNYV
jgi:hypothetical protein